MSNTDEKILSKQELAKKLAEARTTLLLNYPFFGSLVMALKVGIANIGTAATDMRRIIWDPVFLSKLSMEEVEFVTMHEIMHCVLKHCIRGKELESDVYNLACDIVVNSIILNYMGIEDFDIAGEPVIHIVPGRGEGYLYTAEQVYNMIRPGCAEGEIGSRPGELGGKGNSPMDSNTQSKKGGNGQSQCDKNDGASGYEQCESNKDMSGQIQGNNGDEQVDASNQASDQVSNAQGQNSQCQGDKNQDPSTQRGQVQGGQGQSGQSQGGESQGDQGQGGESQGDRGQSGEDQSGENQEGQGDQGQSGESQEGQGDQGQSGENQEGQGDQSQSGENQEGQGDQGQSGEGKEGQEQGNQRQNSDGKGQGNQGQSGHNQGCQGQEGNVQGNQSQGNYSIGKTVDNHEVWGKISKHDKYLEEQWKGHLLEAIKKKKGSSPYGTAIRKLVEKYEYQAKVDWKAVLHDFIQVVYENKDYTFSPYDRRFAHTDFILPAFNEVETEKVMDLWFAIDASGSVSDDMLGLVVSEIKAAASQFDSLSGSISFFDTIVSEPIEFCDEIEFPEAGVTGGGGTSFYAIFEYMQENMMEKLPTAIVVLTDGQAEFPPEEMALGVPVLWILVDAKEDAPWGMITHIKS